RKQSSLSNELILGLRSITASNLSWRDPLASRVISDDSGLVQNLPQKIQNTFL
ncbi:15335_t:CDS:1, partial [Funneliformis caledonium]